MGDDREAKKAKGKKKCIIKWKLMFENYKDCLFNGDVILKSQQRFKSDHHKVYTEEFNKIALSSDDKRLQRVTTYPYGTPAVKVKYLFVKKYVHCPFYGEIVLKK